MLLPAQVGGEPMFAVMLAEVTNAGRPGRQKTEASETQRGHPGMWPGPADSRGLIFLGAPNNLLICNCLNWRSWKCLQETFSFCVNLKLSSCCSVKQILLHTEQNEPWDPFTGLREFIYRFSLKDDDKRQKSKSLPSLTYRAFVS